MSDDIGNQDLNAIAQQAESDLNSKGAQDGSNRGASDSTNVRPRLVSPPTP